MLVIFNDPTPLFTSGGREKAGRSLLPAVVHQQRLSCAMDDGILAEASTDWRSLLTAGSPNHTVSVTNQTDPSALNRETSLPTIGASYGEHLISRKISAPDGKTIYINDPHIDTQTDVAGQMSVPQPRNLVGQNFLPMIQAIALDKDLSALTILDAFCQRSK